LGSEVAMGGAGEEEAWRSGGAEGAFGGVIELRLEALTKASAAPKAETFRSKGGAGAPHSIEDESNLGWGGVSFRGSCSRRRAV
jgi:hypothetical protein